jgi:[acyl-carrier-protein] S-malonyltransferase
VTSAGDIRNALISQVTGAVRWTESVEYMISKGVDTFVEIGPGAVLSGLIKKIDKNVKVFNIDKVSDLGKLAL